MPRRLVLPKQQLALCRERARLEERSLVPCRDRLELVDGGARRLDLTPGKRDVDRRRQQPPAGGLIHRTLGILRRGQRPLDRAPGVVELAARQMQERDAGLPVIAKLVRPLECIGRPLQVAHSEPDLADLVVGVPEAIVQTESLELLAGLACLQLGLWPLAAKHLQLRSMDATDARIAAHCLTPHPALALVGPLARPLQIADVSTGGDRVAQDVARDSKPELARRGRCCRLIEEREPFRECCLGASRRSP